MRATTLFTSLFVYVVLVTSLPHPFRQGGTRGTSLPVKVNLRRGIETLAQRGRERARALTRRTENQTIDQTQPSDEVSLTNTQDLEFSMSVEVGSPPTSYNLILDTGSSNTWIGAIKPYNPMKTSTATGQNVSVLYGTGFFSGIEVIDQVTLIPGMPFTQSIGVASNSSSQFTSPGFDGILGLGPSNLTQGTLFPNVNDTIPTVMENMVSQNIISNNVFGVGYEPVVNGDPNSLVATIDFGEPDLSKITSEFVYAPLTKQGAASGFWGIESSMKLGNATIMAPTTTGIVDTGTTPLLLSTDIFENYVNMTGGVFNETTQFLIVTQDQFLQIPSLFISINGTDLELTRDAQAFPQKLNTMLGVDPNDVILIAADSGMNTSSSGGLDFIYGLSVMQRFYALFDTDNERVGFATTPHTFDVVNVPIPT